MDGEYLAQLTAEMAIRKYVKGRGAVREWVKLRERNEALDLEVYALAALYILGPALIRTLAHRAARLAVRGEASAPNDEEAQTRSAPEALRWRRPRPGGWMSGLLDPGPW